MLSCEPRHAARALTLPQLRAAGLEPRAFLDDCTPRPERPEIGNKWIGAEALRWAGGEDVLIVEDDIDLAPDFPAALELARATGEIAYLYVHEEAERMRGSTAPNAPSACCSARQRRWRSPGPAR